MIWELIRTFSRVEQPKINGILTIKKNIVFSIKDTDLISYELQKQKTKP